MGSIPIKVWYLRFEPSHRNKNLESYVAKEATRSVKPTSKDSLGSIPRGSTKK